MSESLWPDIKEVAKSNNTLDMLKEQADIISKQTNGKINCFFEKIQYNISDMTAIRSAITSFAYVGVGSERIEDELRNKIDIKDCLNPDKGKYKFEIYNNSYRYRLFTYSYSAFFPNVLDADDGICEELKIAHNISINSDEELRDYLKSILSSNSVKIALCKMME